MSSAPRHPVAEALDLAPHPEGGWYRQTWRAEQQVTTDDGRVRSTGTLIYFLLPAGESSAWHTVASDELWLAHTGRVTVELAGAGESPGEPTALVVGTDLAAGERPQVLVPRGVWQRTVPSGEDALVSCVVSPGFDFADFKLHPDAPGTVGGP